MGKVVIILGMHRSGTSCLAGSLQEAGVYLPDVSEKNVFNKKGNRENHSIMSLNDEILAFNDASWDCPPSRRLEWNSSHLIKARDLIDLFSSQNTSLMWGFKDPRTVLTLDFWERVIVNPVFVGTIRNPISVANSLNRRDSKLSLAKGFDLWAHYNEIIISRMRVTQFPLVSFDLPRNEYLLEMKLLVASLGVSPTENQFFENKLRTSEVNEKMIVPEHSAILYEELSKYLL